jgi:glycine betaine/proline transport system substrate-binding protein
MDLGLRTMNMDCKVGRRGDYSVKRVCNITAMVCAVTLIWLYVVDSHAVESSDAIRLTIHDWTGQQISAHIMGEVLKAMGYRVTYVPADYIDQFKDLETGQVHVAMEVWETTGKNGLTASLATGKTLDMGETGMRAIEEWWYPLYVKEQCPGLPDWQALNACKDLFAMADTSPKGRYLSGPLTWGGYDDERADALGLEYVVVHAESESALFAELESAINRRVPILLWVYTPHWAPIKYHGEWVRFPRYTDACYEDPSWGINPNKAYDCGKPRGWIKKVAWAGGEDKWPAAYNAVRKFSITNQEMGLLIGEVDLGGRGVEEVVAEWLRNNEAVWWAWTQ